MNNPDKSYITDYKDYDGRINWTNCFTESQRYPINAL